MRIGISGKIILLSTAVTGLILSLGFYLVSQREAAVIADSMKQETEKITRLIQRQLISIYGDLEDRREHLQRLTQGIGNLEGVLSLELYDRRGQIIAATKHPVVDLSLNDHRNREFALRLLQDPSPLTIAHPDEGRLERFVPIWSTDPDCGDKPIVGAVFLALAYPPGARPEELLGRVDGILSVLSFNVDLHFTDILLDQRRLQTLTEELAAIEGVKHIEVFDSEGAVVAHSDPTEIGRLARASDISLASRAMQTGEITAHSDPATGEYSRFAPIFLKNDKGSDLYFGSVQVVADLGRLQRRVVELRNRLSLTMVALAVVLVASLSFFLRRFVSNPVLRLSRQARAIAEGDFSQPVELHQRDELGRLAASFQMMTTALKHSFEAARAASEFNENLLRSMNEALLVVTPGGSIRSANAAALDLLGYKSDELLGKPANLIIADESADSASRNEQNLGFTENTFIRKDGSRVPVSFSASIIRGASDLENQGIVLVAEDITKLKRALTALRESEERFRKLYEGVPLAYQSTDKSGILLDVNDTWLALFKHSRREVIGQPAVNFVHPSSRHIFRRRITGADGDPPASGTEIQMLKKDGTSFTVLLQGKQSWDACGKLIQNHFVLTDITEMKRLEAQITRGKKDWEETFDAIPDVILLHDADHRILRFNRAARLALDVTWREAVSKECHEVLASVLGTDCPGLVCPGRHSFRTGEASVMEFPNPENGKTFEIQTIPRFGEDENVIGIIHVVRDITERKRHEEILHNIAEGVTRDTGEAFLHSLLAYLVRTLGLDIGLIGEVDPVDSDMVRTVSVIIDGQSADNFEYRLAGTPCEEVAEKDLCAFPEKVADLFPDDPMLREVGAKGYIGAPLFGSDGRALGIIAGLKRSPLENLETLKPLLKIFAARAATELERKQFEDELFKRQESLQSVYSMATTIDGSLEDVHQGTATTLSRVLTADHVFVLRRRGEEFRIAAHAAHPKAVDPPNNVPTTLTPEQIMWRNDTYQLTGYLLGEYPHHVLIASTRPRCMLSVPIRDHNDMTVGAIIVLDREQRSFRLFEIQLTQIFARYIAFRTDRDAMESHLREAQRMEVIGKLAGGVAHEVRNPLNAIMAITDAFAKDLGNNPEYAPFLEHMRNQVTRLSVLMTDLLDLGKPLDASKLVRENLAEICEAALAQWSHSPQSRTHAVDYSLQPGGTTIPVSADHKRLQQVIINLIENAAQHSPPESAIFLTVGREGRNAFFAVTDHGSGISEEYLPRIFETFFSTRRGGTGLGLSIVKKIVDLHRGDIVIFNNDPPPGCTARVVLPLPEEA